MKDNLTTFISEYKKGNHESFLPIVEKLKPAIFKYARNLFRENFEDCVSELELAILESVNKIPNIQNETQCLAFLINAVKNKYLELARKSIKISASELPFEEQDLVCPYMEYEYGNCELRMDIDNLLSECSESQKKILLAVIFEGKNSSQIAAELHTSRQYVNQIKKKWLKQIKKEIYAKETNITI